MSPPVTGPVSEAVVDRPLLPLERERPRALYVHVPFCVRRCHYCDFATGPLEDESVATSWLDALRREASARTPERFEPRTVFVGGGTPTELPERELAGLLELIGDIAPPARLTEWTVEANPGTLTPDKLALLREAGVTRLSLGVQSSHDRILQTLGRIHSWDEAVAAFGMARAAGFDDLNIDLILGTPGSTLSDVEVDLERFIALEPDHVSTYGLTFEPRTNFALWRDQGKLRGVGERTERRMLATVRRALHGEGFRHYETSNFARPGRASRHNAVYWRNGAYLGLGPSAASHVDGIRTSNIRDLPSWLRRVREGDGTAAAETERLDADRKAGETLVLTMRRARGVRRSWLRSRLGFDPLRTEERARALGRAVAAGLVGDDGDRVWVTGSGLALADAILADLL